MHSAVRVEGAPGSAAPVAASAGAKTAVATSTTNIVLASVAAVGAVALIVGLSVGLGTKKDAATTSGGGNIQEPTSELNSMLIQGPVNWVRVNEHRYTEALCASSSGRRLYIFGVENAFSDPLTISEDRGRDWYGVQSRTWPLLGSDDHAYRACDCSADGQTLITLSNSAWVSVSKDYGRTWTNAKPAFTPTGITFTADGSTAYLSGADGKIRKGTSADNFATWRVEYAHPARDDGTIPIYLDVACSSDCSMLVAVGPDVITFRDSAFSSSFFGQNADGTAATKVSVSGDGDTIVVSALNSPLILSTDRAQSFEEVGLVRSYAQSCVSEDGQRIAVGAFGSQMIYSADRGASWTNVTTLTDYKNVPIQGFTHVVCTPSLAQIFTASQNFGVHIGDIDIA